MVALLVDKEKNFYGRNFVLVNSTIFFNETLEGKACTVRKPTGGGWLFAERTGGNLQQKSSMPYFQ